MLLKAAADADAGVADGEAVSILARLLKGKRNRAAALGEFLGVSEQIDKNLPHFALVAEHDRRAEHRGHAKRDAAALHSLGEHGFKLVRHRVEVGRLGNELRPAAFDAAQLKHIVDKAEQDVARHPYLADRIFDRVGVRRVVGNVPHWGSFGKNKQKIKEKPPGS